MKNSLITFLKNLLKNKKSHLQEQSTIEEIVKNIGLPFGMYNLEKITLESECICENRFEIGDEKLIYFYPPNDGAPTCSFSFYRYRKKVLGNEYAYSQITNLDEIILQLVRIFDKSLDENIVLDPYSFMLKLDDEVESNYKGKVSLVITEKAIRNTKLNDDNFEKMRKCFINRFLDHFIGWNFGVSVNRSEILKEEIRKLNDKVIDIGIREWAGPGFEVYGCDNEIYNGLQHYELSTTKDNKGKKLNLK